MKVRSISSLKDLSGKRVLVRVDFNAPVDMSGEVDADGDQRLRAAVPTVLWLAKEGAKVILVSHLGRPEGWDAKLSLAKVASRFSEISTLKTTLITENLENDMPAVRRHVDDMKPGEVVMLENIRFYVGEEKGDDAFAATLASLGEIYVNDAFAVSHRDHASVAGIAKHLVAYAGFLMEREIINLNALLDKPKLPYVVVMGGAKISSKLSTIENLLKVADHVLVGGAMANNFFAAKGHEVGKSLFDESEVKLAKKLLKDKKIILPRDVVAATSLAASAKVRVCAADDVRKGECIVDVGTETMREWAVYVREAQTIVWNGPLGMFENPRFAHGSTVIGRAIAARAKGAAFGVVGGGETVQCLKRTGMSEWIDHVSTGGGAMLEFLAGDRLPGVEAVLQDGR